MKSRLKIITWIVFVTVLCSFSAGCGKTASNAAASESGQEAAQEENRESRTEDSGTDISSEALLPADSSEAEAPIKESTSEKAEKEKKKKKKKAEQAPESGTVPADENAETEETSEVALDMEEGTGRNAESGATGQTSSSEKAAAVREEAGSAQSTTEAAEEVQDQISFDGESDLEYNARQILLADDSITREGALGVAAYLWQMGFGRMSGYPTIGEVNGGKVLTVFDEDGLFYNILLSPEGRIQRVEDVEGNELISLGPRAGEFVKPPLSGADVVALLEEWSEHGGHSQVVAAYNKYAGDYGRSKMSGSDQWCSETVSAAYAALGAADKIGGMASNGDSYERNARSIGAWVSGGGYVPSTGDILITHDGNGERHTACVVSCDGHTIRTIAGGGSSIHHSSISVGSGRITGFVVPEW